MKFLGGSVLAVLAASLTVTLASPANVAMAWDSSCFNPPVTQREVYWLGVSWFGYPDSNLNSNFVTTSNFLSWRYFAASGSSGSEIQVKLDGGSFESMPYPCGALSYTGLSEGVHTLRIEQNLGSGFGWCASWVWENCTNRTFYIDSTPPPTFLATTPTEGQVVRSNHEFRWNPTTDATSGTKSYALFVDGTQVATIDPASCSTFCAATPSSLLADGAHSFYVIATDGGGLTRATSITNFVVRDLPVAILTHSPSQGLTGRAVALSATSSTIPNGGALTYEWDLDNDGTFEKSTGSTGTTNVTFSSRGRKTVNVRVTSPGGLQATSANEFDVFESPPAGEVGVTINDGANYTTAKGVGLSVVWPEYVSKVRISNDGGFKPELTQTFDVNSPISWELDDTVSGVYTKIVYIRFEGTGVDSTRTYSDDIIFDNRPPAVATAEGQVVGEYLNVSLLATDLESGLQTVDIGTEEKFVTTPYSTTILAKTSEISASVSTASVRKFDTGNVKVRVRDKAGNKTAWISISSKSSAKASSISLREISTPSEIAEMARIQTNGVRRLAIKINQASRRTCMMVGGSVIGLKKGTCGLSLVLTPVKGKLSTRSIKLPVG